MYTKIWYLGFQIVTSPYSLVALIWLVEDAPYVYHE